jgi:hypothetical protein
MSLSLSTGHQAVRATKTAAPVSPGALTPDGGRQNQITHRITGKEMAQVTTILHADEPITQQQARQLANALAAAAVRRVGAHVTTTPTTLESIPGHQLAFRALEIADELVRRVGHDEACRRIGISSMDELERLAAAELVAALAAAHGRRLVSKTIERPLGRPVLRLVSPLDSEQGGTESP